MSLTLSLSRSLWCRTTDPSGWSGLVALLCLFFLPALALAEALVITGLFLHNTASRMLATTRRAVGRMLRALANRIDPEPEIPWERIAPPEPEKWPDWTEERWTIPAPATEENTAASLPATTMTSRVALPVVSAPVITEPEPQIMSGAARDGTTESLPVESPESRAVAEHGGIRAAARALGMAESTLRSRLNRQRKESQHASP